MNSKQKGKRGELEVARLLRSHGYEGRRTAQYCGKTGEASDVVGLPGIHIEVKRVERLDLAAAMSQAKRDAAEGEMPTVFHRRNDAPWMVTLSAEDFMALYREWEAGPRNSAAAPPGKVNWPKGTREGPLGGVEDFMDNKNAFIITFPTTTAAMQMQACAEREALPGRIIPVPRSLSAGCGMAWTAPVESKAMLCMAIEQLGIPVSKTAVMDYAVGRKL